MKKLIFVMAVGLIASIANAATVAWSGLGVSTTGAATAATSWSVYLLDSEVTSASALASVFASKDASAIKDAINNATVATTTGLAQGTAAGRWSTTATLPSTYIQGDEVTFYTLILDQAIPTSGAGSYFVTATKTGTVSDSTSLAMGFGAQGSGSWTSYTTTTADIPEPTSGLLLLLGAAGLALKRKRA